MSSAPDTSLGHADRSTREENRPSLYFHRPFWTEIVLSISARPRAAAILMAIACACRALSASKFSVLIADMTRDLKKVDHL